MITFYAINLQLSFPCRSRFSLISSKVTEKRSIAGELMAKVRVYSLANKLNLSNREVLTRLSELGIEAKSHSSSIEQDDALRLEKSFKKRAAGKETTVPLEGEKAKKAARTGLKAVKKVVRKAGKPLKGEEVPPVRKKKAVKKEKVVVEEKPAEAPRKKKETPLEQPEKPSFEEKTEVPKHVMPPGDAGVVEGAPREHGEGLEKIKDKPGMQRAFDAIRRVDVTKKRHGFRTVPRKHGRKLAAKKSEAAVAVPVTQPRKRHLKFQEGTTVKEFSELIGQKLPDVMKKFIDLGSMPTINQPVDPEAAQIVAELYGIKIEQTQVESEEVLLEEAEIDAASLLARPPIVTIMGHVDHGKTTMLDAIRKTNVTEGEAGGITQHIGAYKVTLNDREVVFLDTPGHEAFTTMRARGAKVTDIVVLVVAADDSVMPQTIEAIDHAKAANVPIVVAINKIDKPEADISRVRSELSRHGVVSEEWGGKNIFVEVSAKQNIGIEHLLEMILLQAEVMELKAPYDRTARGTIIEAKLDRGRGPVATVLVNSGILRSGDSFIVGTVAGKVRALIDDSGRKVKEAGPSTPVEVTGFPDVPQAGDIFVVMDDERKARQIAMIRLQKEKSLAIARKKKLTLDDVYDRIKEGEIKELNVIIKADVQGSVGALKDSLENIHHPEVKVKVIHTGVGGINTSDVMLAAASNAIIIGFNIRPDSKASAVGEKEGVDIMIYNVIYEAIDDIKNALEGLLAPTISERVLGKAEVRNIFQASRIGTIAGCYVLEGTITRASSGIRVIRDNVVIYESKISSLKRFKDDVKEVQTGFECGIMVENFNDIKEGDILEVYLKEEVASSLNLSGSRSPGT
jgi:translation initiation factor IF-2